MAGVVIVNLIYICMLFYSRRLAPFACPLPFVRIDPYFLVFLQVCWSYYKVTLDHEQRVHNGASRNEEQPMIAMNVMA